MEIDDILCEGMTKSISTKVETISQNQHFIIYPNPSNDGKCIIIVDEVCDVIVTNLVGDVVKQLKAIPQFDNEITLPEQGVYIVRAGTVVEKVIVK